jgi:hypothetical protein
MHPLRLRASSEYIGHPSLELETIVEDDFRVNDRYDIVTDRFVQMWVNTGRNQLRQLHRVASDTPDHVGDHPGRGHNRQSL